jgi:hypothetical protein
LGAGQHDGLDLDERLRTDLWFSAGPQDPRLIRSIAYLKTLPPKKLGEKD